MYNMNEFIRSCGGIVDFRKLCRWHANRVLKWSASRLDLWGLVGNNRGDILDELTSVLIVRISEVVGTYNPEFKPSTFIGSQWRTMANHLAREIWPSLTTKSVDEQSDRGGSSRQQGTDRYLNDWAGKVSTDRNRLADSEEFQKAIAVLTVTERQVVEWRLGGVGVDQVGELLGRSQGWVSKTYHNALDRMRAVVSA